MEENQVSGRAAMAMETVAIIGCGDLGVRAGERLVADGYRVLGLRRRPVDFPGGIEGRVADVEVPASLAFLGAESPALVLYAVAASGHAEDLYRRAYVDGLRNVLDSLDVSTLRRFLFVSSTSVYGQDDGSWVDEDSPTEPTRFTGRLVLEGERIVRATGRGTCVRLSGIYGPGRTRLIDQVRAGKVASAEPVRYSNRIHVDDAAAALQHLVRRLAAGPPLEEVYLASDSEPATPADVQGFLADRLGIPPDQRVVVVGPHRAGNKRCRNRRLIETGFTFQYPDFRAGYDAVLGDTR